MPIKRYKPYTPSRRTMTVSDFSELADKKPEKRLLMSKKRIHATSPWRRCEAPVPRD